MRGWTEELQAAWSGDLTTFRTIHFASRLPASTAAALCGVSPETFRRWGRDRAPNPAALRLLTVMAGYLPWDGWHGWEMAGGYLFPPGYSRGGLRPGDVLALPYLLQLLNEHRRQARRSRVAAPSAAPSGPRSVPGYRTRGR